MDARHQKAEALVAGGRITRGNGFFWVPSQSPGGRHKVVCGDLISFCTCEDHELTGKDCKHILAVKLWLEREKATESLSPVAPLEMPPPPKRKTYPQDWPNYDLAQCREKGHFQELLADLTAGLPDNPPKGGKKGGRPAIPLRDAVYAIVSKVYGEKSARRSIGDMEEANGRGHLSRPLCFSSVVKSMDNPALFPVLCELVRESALPLAAVETDFAVDSSGFMTSRYVKWFDQKYGTMKQRADWVKVHICTGVKTNCVTAVEIADQHAADSPMLPSLVEQTARGFKVQEVSADKAYAGNPNFEAVALQGGTFFPAFRSSTTGAAGGLFGKAFHYFNYRREEYLAHYHKRSNVESTFSAVKRKFGDAVRSKTDPAMKNEVLCKLICQNLTCLIAAIYELGIVPVFWQNADEDAPAVIRFPSRG